MPKRSTTVEECLEKMRKEGRLTEGKTAGELFAQSVKKSVVGRTKLPDVRERRSEFASITPLNQDFVLEALTNRVLSCSSEKEFQQCVMELAWAFGWKVIHFRKVLVQMGKKVHYETPYGGDGKGTPDLEFIRERLVKAELKFGKGKPTPEQLDRLDDYRAAGVEAYIWWPKDWDKIVKTLSPVPIREPKKRRPKK